MPLVFNYRDPKGVDEPAVSVSLGSNSVRFGTLSLSESAELGEPATSTLDVDDPDAVWNFVGLRALSIAETSAPSNNQLILAAAIQNRKVTRDDSMRTGAARKWTLDLVDYNWHLGRTVFVDSDAKRPAETAGDRLRWLLSNNSRIAIRDLGNVTYPTTSLDATDYRGQRVTDLLADCCVEGGYNFWIAPNEAASRPELFFLDPGSSAYSSTLRISNDLSDIDYTTTFPPDEDAELTRSAARIAYGVYLAYAKGAVYVRNDTMAEQFAKVDQTAPMSNVKTEARARRIATKFLNDHDEESDRITCAVRVPAAQVNAIRAGHRVEVKFTHFPGYEVFTWARVMTRTVRQEELGGGYEGMDNSEAWYALNLELVPTGGQTTTAVYGVMFAPGPGLPETNELPSGWTETTSVFETYGLSEPGMILAFGSASGSQDITWTHVSSRNELAVAQLGGLTSAVPVNATTAVDNTAGTVCTIDCVADGPGIILAAIHINNFDSGTRTLAKMDDYVTIYERMNTLGVSERAWGAVNFGYLPVSAAGTYTITWTMSNQFNWTKTMVAAYLPSEAATLVQSADSGRVTEWATTASLPDPF